VHLLDVIDDNTNLASTSAAESVVRRNAPEMACRAVQLQLTPEKALSLSAVKDSSVRRLR